MRQIAAAGQVLVSFVRPERGVDRVGIDVHDRLGAGGGVFAAAGPGMGGAGPFGLSSGTPVPVAVENFHALKNRQTADSPAGPSTSGRVNLLNWDGTGTPDGMFPPRHGKGAEE